MKETTLSVLKEIRDILREQKPSTTGKTLTDYFVITDDGKSKTSELLQECRDKFPVYSWLGNEQLDKNFPPPQKSTTRKFKRNVEGDEEYKNMSADDLMREKIEGITLRERIIMELQYFKETGNHLDIHLNSTLCSGSRCSGGYVPRAGWFGGEFLVDWYAPGLASSSLRARAVVS